MSFEYKIALVKLRALVGGNATIPAEDIVRTTLRATRSIVDGRIRAQFEARLTYRLVRLGLAPTQRRNNARRKVETILDRIERLSRPSAPGSARRPSMINNRLTGID